MTPLQIMRQLSTIRNELESIADCLQVRAEHRAALGRIADIQEAVCAEYSITLPQMIGPSRMKALSMPRFVAMWLACQLVPERGQRAIATCFKRDRTTLIYAIERVEAKRLSNREFYDRTNSLLARLGGNIPAFPNE
jgi:chromosomal replication initiation ATPase DnaA